MPEDGRPGMSKSASSTTVHPAGPPGPAPTLAMATPEATPKPEPAAEAQGGVAESSFSDDRDSGFLMHPRSVYIVISEGRELNEKFHWSIIVACSQSEGILYHCVFDGSQWILEIEKDKDIPADKAVILILKVGDVPEVSPLWVEAIQECITTARVPETTMGAVSCRTFALAAVYELGNSGFISLYPNWNKINGIEREAYQFAWHAGTLRRRLVVASQWSDL